MLFVKEIANGLTWKSRIKLRAFREVYVSGSGMDHASALKLRLHLISPSLKFKKDC